MRWEVSVYCTLSLKMYFGDFLSDLVVKTLAPNAEGIGLIPGHLTKIQHAVWYGQKKKKKGILS